MSCSDKHCSGTKSTISSKWAAIFALQAAFSVAAGAFGAHALTTILDPKALGWWSTASQYLMYHALAGLIITALFSYLPFHRSILMLFLVGNALFSGSLYAMALTGNTFLGAITPLGGVCYLLAWCGLVFRLWRFKTINQTTYDKER